jgi:membrane protein implicated in regulation of membrane protease activity
MGTDWTPYLWLALGAVLIGIEVMLGSTWLIWPAISAALVGLGAFAVPYTDWRVQLVLFALLAVATTFIWQRWFRGVRAPTDRPQLNRRTEALVGRRGPLGADGLHLDDTIWRVRDADGGELPATPAGGRVEVEVIGADGPVLLVRPVLSPAPNTSATAG